MPAEMSSAPKLVYSVLMIFNEAAGTCPRKYVDTPKSEEGERSSMRPRARARGNVLSIPPDIVGPKRLFNEAAGTCPRKYVGIPTWHGYFRALQ